LRVRTAPPFGDHPNINAALFGADTGRAWSDAELTQLGNLLVGGLSIEEIAQLLDRDRGDIQDKVVEMGRACRGSTAANSEW
jgi:hypothetical protein